MNSKVDAFLNEADNWQHELAQLRRIILDCGLTEEMKWSVPVYTHRGRNIVAINGLKDSCTLAFFKGALLADAEGILTKPGTHTYAGRWVKVTSADEIAELEPILKAYIFESVEVEKAGLKVNFKQKPELLPPQEFQLKLSENPILRAAFAALTPGRRRAYLLHFLAPKQSKTREARIEKCLQQILEGRGLNDDYGR